jgi:hypothetical protein
VTGRKTPADPDAKVFELRPTSPTARGGAKSKSSPAAIALAERRRQAVALRRNGANFIEIAEAISRQYGLDNYDNKAASADVREALAKVKLDQIGDYIDESVARLDYMLLRIADRVSNGDLEAIDRVLKIEKRRADLLGLDAVRRIQLTGADGGPIQLEARVFDNDDEAYDAAVAAVNELLGPPLEISG